jgi:hypothetical protein
MQSDGARANFLYDYIHTGFQGKPGFFLFLEPREAESLPLPTMENQGNYGDMLFTGSLIEGH